MTPLSPPSVSADPKQSLHRLPALLRAPPAAPPALPAAALVDVVDVLGLDNMTATSSDDSEPPPPSESTAAEQPSLHRLPALLGSPPVPPSPLPTTALIDVLGWCDVTATYLDGPDSGQPALPHSAVAINGTHGSAHTAPVTELNCTTRRQLRALLHNYFSAHLSKKNRFDLESHSQFILVLVSNSPTMKLHTHLNRELWVLPNLIKWLSSPNVQLHMHLNRELWVLPNFIKWL